MRKHLEREIKLSPPEGFVLPELGGETSSRVFSSTYHDTSDLRLARRGVTLRYRVEDGGGAWQLKLPRADARLELERPGTPARPPQELVALLPAFLRGEELVKVARLRTNRAVVHTDGAEVLDDAVAVFQGPRITRRFRELEVELLEGDERTLRRLEGALRRAGADRGPLRPKLHRALALVVPEQVLEPTAGTAAGPALGLRLREQVVQLLSRDPGVRLGEVEDVHQLRVATRRLRAFLRAGRPLVEREWADGLREELGWLAGSLGPVRDRDVLQAWLEGELTTLGEDAAVARDLLRSLAGEREDAHAQALDVLESERYLALLDRLDGVDEPPLVESELGVSDLFRGEHKRAKRAFRTLGKQPTDDDLHSARIRVKRSRYAAELAAHELGGRGRKVIAGAKRLQDVLGAHQDAVVAEVRLRAWADDRADAGVAAGLLIGRAQARKDDARTAWPPLWEKLDKLSRKA